MEMTTQELQQTIIVGRHTESSIANDQTRALFQSFMPNRNKIAHRLNDKVLDIQLYPDGYFDSFQPAVAFTKWAAVAVSSVDELPDGMESMLIEAGLYAQFLHQGPMTDSAPFEYIYREWLPTAPYLLDRRPHFDVMSVDPDHSGQEIWIPIRHK